MPWSPIPLPELTLPPGLGWSPTGPDEPPLRLSLIHI